MLSVDDQSQSNEHLRNTKYAAKLASIILGHLARHLAQHLAQHEAGKSVTMHADIVLA